MLKRMISVLLALLLLAAPIALAYEVELPVQMDSRGDTVTLVQEKLQSLGLLSGKADGIFGAKTKAAVVKLQKKRGLQQTGVVDQETFDALIDESTRKSVSGYQEFLLILAASLESGGLDAHIAVPQPEDGRVAMQLSGAVALDLQLDEAQQNVTGVTVRADMSDDAALDQIACALIACGAGNTIAKCRDFLRELGAETLEEAAGEKAADGLLYAYRAPQSGQLEVTVSLAP